MRSFFAIPFLACLVSCGADSKPESTPQRKPLEHRMNEKNGYTQDASGQWVPQTDRRSSFDGKKESPYFKGDYGTKQYKAGDYAKKSWWGGDSTYNKKSYEGKTDGSRFQTANRESQKSARDAGQQARESSSSFATSGYKTGSAREGGKGEVKRTSDAETDNRRKVYDAPSVIDWEAQREMSVQESRSILGN